MSRHRASTHHRDQLLDFLFHVMGQDLRARVMRELPAAYNDYHGSEIVEVLRTADGSKVSRALPAPSPGRSDHSQPIRPSTGGN
ncbi:MAG TPA: hypothetical protein VHY83_11900 [Solirubrobacteraceae bacterium]|nr:hypothetical protein [Solirubrobacteraceae bacterium]